MIKQRNQNYFEQDVKQDQFLSGLLLVWIHSFPSP